MKDLCYTPFCLFLPYVPVYQRVFFFLIECIPLSEAAEKQHHHPPAFTLHTPLNTIKNVFTFFFFPFSACLIQEQKMLKCVDAVRSVLSLQTIQT